MTQFSTPAGMPASFIRPMIFSVVSGVELAGFTTMVFPAMSAGPSLVPISVMGKFQGTMAPHTPTGRFTTRP